MFIAIASKSNVLEVASNEAASLEGMSAYCGLGYKNVRRIIATEQNFIDYSNGRELETDIEVTDGKATTVIVAK